MQHKPVLITEIIEHLEPRSGEVYVDATFGAGGYTSAILKHNGTKVIAFDQDPEVKNRAASFTQKYGDRFVFIQSNFAEIQTKLAEINVKKIDGIVYDLGVSSMQLDQAERGFSFAKEAELDMRMSKSGVSAKEVVNNEKEEDLANIIFKYGEERKSRQIARLICKKRAEKEIETTTELADIIYAAKRGGREGKIDAATKTFQAIRIYINNELESFKKSLASLTDILQDKARLLVVSFHSLEDKIIKEFLISNNGIVKASSRYLPELNLEKSISAFFKLVNKKPITPSEAELKSNNRSRSAKLRVAIWQLGHDNSSGD